MAIIRSRLLQGDEIVLRHKQLYMLPTRAGLVFTVLLVVLLLASINYNNGLAYALTFLLAAMGIVSMLYTHANLLKLHIRPGRHVPVFAGEAALFQVCLHNPGNSPRPGLHVRHDKQASRPLDLAPHSESCTTISVPARQRGVLAIPDLTISTEFPLGLLYSWSRRIRLNSQTIVYPRPAAPQPLPQPIDGEQGERLGHAHDGDDFTGLREYTQGDAPRHVHWKSVAKTGRMVTKQFENQASTQVWLHWHELNLADTESRLSLLCRWVLEAEQHTVPYGLTLPGVVIKPGLGHAHKQRCLQALALFKIEP
ncbi:MAG: DUF58 domain-containing protein [Gammaproteobacteria bacterium]|nr:MAG: DUF58 domain-containing protein [Gammaproteobacteria bacterium]